MRPEKAIEPSRSSRQERAVEPSRSLPQEKTTASTRSSAREKSVDPVRVTREDLSVKPDRVTRDDIREKLAESKTAPDRSREKADRSSRQAREISSVIQTDRTRVLESSVSRPSISTDSSLRTENLLADRSIREAGIRTDSYRSERTVTSNTSQIIINGDNNVIVQGDVTVVRPRPYIPRRLYGSTVFIGTSPGWYDYGSYFSFHWSSSSIGRVACFPYRRHYGFSYYYPSYHRKYVFVSLGGYWPCSYRYRRYYWYGCHPHYWYGAHVIPQETVVYNTCNTYNTYNTYSEPAPVQSSTTFYDQYATDYRYPFGDAKPDLSGLFDKKSVPADAPEYESPADLCFANAIDLFADGSWEAAADQFRDAVALSPDDVIMPFAYSQALFAEGSYAHAASVLRSVMAALPEDELTIYYPRGLYEKEEVLLAQVDELKKAIAVEPFNSDFQLVLGYQYLGLGQLDKALEPLGEAAKDPANEPTAAKLLELAAKLEESQSDS